MRTTLSINKAFGLLLVGLFLEPTTITKSHAHFVHEGINYSGTSIPKLVFEDVPTHYKCSTFINKTDGSHFDEEFEISFYSTGADIARRNKNNTGTLPRRLKDITSSKWDDWTDRFHRTYSGVSSFGFYNQIWVVQFWHKDSLKIYRTIMTPYTKDKQHSLYVSSCEEFH